jgi:hypothetical protein
MANDTQISEEEVTGLPGSDESFDADALPVMMELVTERLKEYVSQQMHSDEPLSLIGFAMELIYQTGYKDAEREIRGRRR